MLCSAATTLMLISRKKQFLLFCFLIFQIIKKITSSSPDTNYFPGLFLQVPWTTLQWRYNERDGISNHRHLDCLLNRLFRHRSKETSKLRITGLYEGNPLVTGRFHSQRASNAENVFIWWYHHDMRKRDRFKLWHTREMRIVFDDASGIKIIYCLMGPWDSQVMILLRFWIPDACM